MRMQTVFGIRHQGYNPDEDPHIQKIRSAETRASELFEKVLNTEVKVPEGENSATP